MKLPPNAYNATTALSSPSRSLQRKYPSAANTSRGSLPNSFSYTLCETPSKHTLRRARQIPHATLVHLPQQQQCLAVTQLPLKLLHQILPRGRQLLHRRRQQPQQRRHTLFFAPLRQLHDTLRQCRKSRRFGFPALFACRHVSLPYTGVSSLPGPRQITARFPPRAPKLPPSPR